MKGKITITFFILLQVILQYSIAQNNLDTFTIVKGPGGKPTGKITSITQDRHGYMWFAGQDHQTLFRFDGSNWISFGMDNANPNALKATALEKVYADDSGMIWVGGNGMDQLNPSTRIFTHFRHEDNDPGSLSSNAVFAILKDRQGRLWVGTDNGLNRLDNKTGKFIRYHNEPGNPHSLSSNSIWTIYEDHEGVIWIGTGNPFNDDLEDGGLNRLESGYTFTRYMHDPNNSQSLGNNKVRSIFEDSRGKFWIGTGRNGFYSMDRKTGSFEQHTFTADSTVNLTQTATKPDKWKQLHEQVSFICEDKGGQIWTGSMWSGIRRYDIEGKKYTLYKSGNDFPDSSGWTGYVSRDGVLWIGTEDSHLLYKGEPFPKKINSINTGSMGRDFIEEKNKILWVSTNKGLLQFDQQQKLNLQVNNSVLNPKSVFDESIMSLASTDGDTIWLGTDSGVGVYNTKTRELSRFSLGIAYTSPETSAIWDIFKDKKNNIWFATGEGAIVYDPKDRSTMRYQHNDKDTTSIMGNRITSILEARNGDFWIAEVSGGKEGINRLDKGTNQFRHYLENYRCLFLYEDSDGTIWACTSKGLYQYIKNTDRFSSFFDTQSGYNNDWIFSVVEDNDKNLWFTTSSIIGKIYPDKKRYTVYGSKYGIPTGSISPKSAYKATTGQLLIGHAQGFYAFYPEELRDNPAMEIRITDFFINDIPILPLKDGALQKPIEETVDIELQYDQKNIGFNFRAIDYSEASSAIRYYSMLEGYDNSWREAIQGKYSFYNISPGDYVFRIKAFTSEGMKGEKTISILVHPPWWKTWWAYSLYFILLGILLFAVYRAQRQRIIRKEQEKAQQFELEQAKEIEKAYHELRSTQAQLIQSEKMASLGELTAGIAHEIQNPLNFVNNFSEVNIELAEELKIELNKSGLTPEEKNSLVNYIDDILQNELKINDHGQRAGSIVKSMLQHSRTSGGQKEPTDINELADEFLRLAYHGQKSKDKFFNVTLKTDFDPSIGKISLIPQDIGRVMINLYNNAFYAVMEKKKIAPEGYEPAVSVSTKKTDRHIEICVKDNGTGIPQKIVDKIFQPFFTTKPTGQGTGLGLSLSYDIIKAHQGEINVASMPNEGTEFTVLLPCK